MSIDQSLTVAECLALVRLNRIPAPEPAARDAADEVEFVP
jgi:hypothetical protein